MTTSYNLKATTQASYYGKAKVIETGEAVQLKSYDTIVCEIVNGEFRRLWGGYSRTTMNHINDFRRLFGLDTINKKEWMSLPCGSDEQYKVEFSNGFVCWTAGTIFDSESQAWEFAEKVQESRNFSIFADVIRA